MIESNRIVSNRIISNHIIIKQLHYLIILQWLRLTIQKQILLVLNRKPPWHIRPSLILIQEIFESFFGLFYRFLVVFFLFLFFGFGEYFREHKRLVFGLVNKNFKTRLVFLLFKKLQKFKTLLYSYLYVQKFKRSFVIIGFFAYLLDWKAKKVLYLI